MADWPYWLKFRPIVVWPGEQTKYREKSKFSAPFSDTVNLLWRELEQLNAKHAVLQVALTERWIRIDGMPYANARAEHPGVILAFESKYGQLSYATDTYPTWEENLRGIAKSLENLRAVDRYGVSKGQQYQGWKQLGAGPTMSQSEAAELILHLADWNFDHVMVNSVIVDREIRRAALRAASKKAHPDTGGSAELWNKLAQARALLPS